MRVLPPGSDVDPTESRRLDDLIRRYAADPRRWPSRTARERAMLYHRFENALSLLAALAKSPVPAPEFSGEMIEWLLVTSWIIHGEQHWADSSTLCRLVSARLRPPTYPARPEDGFAA